MGAGLDIILISRTKSKLEDAAREISQNYSVQTQLLVADFSKADQETYSQLSSSLSDLDIGVLVNNVGLSYDHAEYFDQIDDQLIEYLVTVNIQATNKVGAHQQCTGSDGGALMNSLQQTCSCVLSRNVLLVQHNERPCFHQQPCISHY